MKKASQLFDAIQALVGQRIKETTFYAEGYTGVIKALAKNGKVLVKWDAGGEDEELALNQFEILASDARNEAEIRAELRDRFVTLETMTQGVAKNQITGMMVSGPGGVGKTFTIERELKKVMANKPMQKQLSRDEDDDEIDPQEDLPYISITGHSSPLALYETLYQYSGAGNVLVFDDCDSIFDSEKGINLLKAALDTKPRRILSWRSKSRLMEAPQSFVFEANIIFLTNKVPGGDAHFDALMTRIHYIDLNMTPMEIFYRIEDVADAIEHRAATKAMKKEVLKFMQDNIDRFGSRLSIRTLLLMLGHRLMAPTNWKPMVEATILRR